MSDAAPSPPSLILRCRGHSFALPLEAVVEVTRMVAPATSLPRAPAACLGAADYHGQMVPIFELGALLLALGARTIVELVDGRLVFVRTAAGLLGLAVDEVPELSERPVEPLSASGPRLAGANDLVRGIVRWREGEAAPLLLPSVLLASDVAARLQALLRELQPPQPPQLKDGPP